VRTTIRGFTLIEMLLVISIIILLMALLVPQIGAVMQGVRVKDTQRRIATLHTAVEDYFRLYGAYPPSTSPPTPSKGGRVRWDYLRYRFPDGTEADDLFGHGYHSYHPYGGKFLAYFLMGFNGMGWHRPENPRNTADPDYVNRFITAEWDVPGDLTPFLFNRPDGIRGDRAAPGGTTPMKCPCFLDAFGPEGAGGGLIGYIAANPRASGPARWLKDSYGNANNALAQVYYEDCGRDETSAIGREHLARTLASCPYGFAIISPGPNKRYGYRVYGRRSGGKVTRRWYADLDVGITDDIANYPLR